MTNPKPFRSAFISFIGRPNSGKSTLMNTIMGEQLSVVTSLPQTTRRNLRGIYTTDDMQLIFVDTPGIHRGKHAFNESMIREARSAVTQKGIDLICYIVDLSREFGDEETAVSELVIDSGIPVLVIFNKTDLAQSAEPIIENFFSRYPRYKDKPYIKLSANRTEAKDVFLKAVDPFISEGPKFYDQDELTDSSLRFFAAEYIRKQIILNTREEVPHASFVEIESYKETEARHDISAVIHVETTGQRGIIVGQGGSIIKKIRKSAEREMQRLVGVPVAISCHIKVSPKWRDNEGFLRNVGMPR